MEASIDSPFLERRVILRSALPQDDLFLFKVYASTRANEMALLPWNEEQKEAFLRMQFEAQRRHYALHFPQAKNWIIVQKDETGGQSIGRMIVGEQEQYILLIDIALLLDSRGKGIGSALIRALQQQAASISKPLVLHVEVSNPAQRLYERLGFVKTAETGIYIEMIWKG